jgi:phosphoribosylglycinamide formyltransferase-1
MKKLAIFASGSGTNAQRIAEYFSGHPQITIKLILCNKPDAYVLTRAAKLGINSLVFDRKTFYETDEIPRLLKKENISLIVLAGFLWLIPQSLLEAFPNRIINIHPALLPKFGGKGMYGEKVHRAVLEAGEMESGISIHRVNQNYDEGSIILQARCPVFEDDSPETLAARIHELEYRHFPLVIEKILGE